MKLARTSARTGMKTKMKSFLRRASFRLYLSEIQCFNSERPEGALCRAILLGKLYSVLMHTLYLYSNDAECMGQFCFSSEADI